MSVRVMADVWSRFPGKGSRLLIMLALADYANEHGDHIYPSIRALSVRVRLTRSQTQRVLHGLISDGWINVIANATGGAPGTTRHYRLNVEKLRETGSIDATPTGSAHAARRGSAHAAPTGSADATGSVSATGSTNATRTGRTHAADGSHPCDPIHHDPLRTPSLSRTHAREGATPVPPDFAPTQQTISILTARAGVAKPTPENIWSFVDHYQGTGELREDWQAVFRKWMTREQRSKGNGASGHPQIGRKGSGARMLETLDDLEKRKSTGEENW